MEIGQMKRDALSMSRMQFVAQLERWERLLGHALGERSTGEVPAVRFGEPGDE